MKVPMFIGAILLALFVGAGGGFLLRKSEVENARQAIGEAPSDDEATIGSPARHGRAPASQEQFREGEREGDREAGQRGSRGKAKKDPAYLKFSRQFYTPIVVSGRPVGLMIMDVIIELDPSFGNSGYPEEPIVRDAIVRVLLKEAGEGRLAKIFADSTALEATRAELLRETRAIIGEGARSVLIVDVGYQSY